VPTARDLLAGATLRLSQAGVPSPQVDAELLLAHVTHLQRATLRTFGSTVPADQAAAFEDLVERRAERVPLQHLTGTAPFRYIELRVGPGVFVPRPETELVADVALAVLRAGRAPGQPTPGEPPPRQPAPGDARRPTLVDLCTGSGALAIALALEAPGSRVVAVELAGHAHAWAARNVADHEAAIARVGSSLDLLHADATTVADDHGPLASLRGQVDVVVTNPPYVPDGAVPREPEVRDHDPGEALFGGPDGLDVVRPLVAQAALLLRPGGLVVVEHADSQGEGAGSLGVPGVLRSHLLRARSDVADPGPGTPAWTDVRDHADLAGRPRFTTAVRSNAPAW
jgi:release factor glutamine methyltransferase